MHRCNTNGTWMCHNFNIPTGTIWGQGSYEQPVVLDTLDLATVWSGECTQEERWLREFGDLQPRGEEWCAET